MKRTLEQTAEAASDSAPHANRAPLFQTVFTACWSLLEKKNMASL